MIGTSPAIHALGGGSLRLVGAGALLGSISFNRASSGWSIGANGATWMASAPDAPRFNGVARRLLVEGQRTNGLTNPRLEFTGGPSFPTTIRPRNWVYSSSTFSLIEYTPATENGLPCVDIRLVATAASSVLIYTGSHNEVPTAINTAWTGSVCSRLVSGDATGLTNCYNRVLFRQADLSAATAGAVDTPLSLTASLTRTIVTNNSGADGVYAQQAIRFGCTGAGEWIIRVGGMQIEQGAMASSLILSSPGVAAAVTRAADVPTLVLTAMQAQRGTLVGTFMFSTSDAVTQGLFTLHDGTSNNRLGLRGSAAGLGLVRAVGGSSSFSGFSAALSAGVPFKAALSWDAGGFSAAINGTAVPAIAGATPVVNSLTLGHGLAPTGFTLFGEIGPLDLHPTRLPDATLQALTAA
ncbi:MAG TPA: hypothetical protein VIL69_00095 [Roseomonas sp.]|jgi:hypothetical protein